MKIVFAGGGSAGHIIPIIAITREIRRICLAAANRKQKEPQFIYFGPKDEFSSILLSQEGIKIKYILTGKIRRSLDLKSFFQNLIDILFKIPVGAVQAFTHLLFLGPDLIFSKGGYGSVPVVISGWILETPIFLHESDSVPGLANRFLSKSALKIFVSFQETECFPLEKMILTGNPIRKEILQGSKEEATKLFKLKKGKPLILILGGSQGAQRINDKILEILPELLKNFEILHQCGEKNFKQVKAESEAIIPKTDLGAAPYNHEESYTGQAPLDKNHLIGQAPKKHYHLFPFLREEEIKQAYQAADLVISRAGAGSIFEIAALGKPSILIPLPESAQNHQIKNAYAYARNEACLVVEENNFTARFFLGKLKHLVSNLEKLEKMSLAAREFSKPQAARIIAEHIVNHLT